MMLEGPLRWEIFSKDNFLSYRPSRNISETCEVQADFLIYISDAGPEGDRFRIVFGNGVLHSDIQANYIFKEEELKHYILTLNFDTSRIDMRVKSFTTRWFNLDDLVRSKKILVKKRSSKNLDDISKEFLDILTNVRGKKCQGCGVSIRWALLATPTCQLVLVLQCLPETAAILRKDPRTSVATVPTVVLLSYTVEIEMSENSELCGPVPKLFVWKPEDTRESLLQDSTMVYPSTYKMYKNC
jgi:hypothetical protein